MFDLRGLAQRSQSRVDYAQALAVTLASAYVSGNALGGLITIDNSTVGPGPIEDITLSVILQDLVVADLDGQGPNIDFYFFNAPPSAVVDKTAFAPTVADLKKLIGLAHVLTTDYTTINGQKVANKTNLQMIMRPGVPKATAIYCVPVVLGTPTYTNGIQVRFQFQP